MAQGSRLAAGIGLLAGLLFAVHSAAAPTALPAKPVQPVNSALPTPAAMMPQIAFWTRVYVEIDTGAGFVHDNRRLNVVYETMRVSDDRTTRRRQVKARKRHWRAVLKKLASGARPSTAADRHAVELWQQELGRTPTPKDFKAALDRVRFQRGQRNRFEEGLVRSGRYDSQIRSILKSYGVPEDLAYLPHVESSYNTYAYSKFGAAGMWQFMRSTGRLYLRIDGVVDERLAPIKASHAAAKLLRDNYARLGTWPLAITAYNHGANGMRRAQRTLGTSDIMAIVERYDGRRFGFASRNFYAQFLAARQVAREYRRHFGDLALDSGESVQVVRLPFYADSHDVMQHLGIERRTLAALNPSLRKSVLYSERYIPSGFELRVPGDLSNDALAALATEIPPERRFEAQRAPRIHRVRRGETLGRIAKRYGTSVSRLVAINNLNSAHRIRVGQRIELAEPRPRAKATMAAKRQDNAKHTKQAAAVRVTQTAAATAPTRKSPPWRGVNGEWTVVDHHESLAHYARWLSLPASRLRRLNAMSARSLKVGQKIRLDFSEVGAEEFSRRRGEHHAAIEKRFFSQRAVTGTLDHTVKEGENLWKLANEVYRVPTWLLHRYNPQATEGRLMPGMQVTVPVLSPIAEI